MDAELDRIRQYMRVRTARAEQSGGCHAWIGPRCRAGYGRVNGAQFEGFVYAHRLAWRLANGPIPSGMHVLHACDHPWCVNVAHLHIGTVADNMREKAARGRAARNTGGHKLTPDQVRAIREGVATGATHLSQASRYGVTPFTIWRVVSRRV